MQKNRGQSSWISLSDLMTGLMLVFLLIAVIMQDPMRCGSTKQKIQTELKKIEKEIPAVKFSPTHKCELSIELRADEENPLFEKDQAIPTKHFENILDAFIPDYLNDVLQNKEIKDHIQEVRIEGHTGEPTPLHPTYISLVKLSQERARAILKYFKDSKTFKALHKDEKKSLYFKLMAVGFGNGRTIDENRRYTIDSGNPTNEKSRRVEFRIMTEGGIRKPRKT